MQNYEAINQWAASVNLGKAIKELTNLKRKYPWLKCDETMSFLTKLQGDLPKIVNVIKLQEKQNNMHQEFIRVSQIADLAIVEAIQTRFNL